MKREILSQFPYIWLTISAMLVFFAVFTSMIALTWRKGSSSKYQEIASLPLSNDSGEVNRNE